MLSAKGASAKVGRTWWAVRKGRGIPDCAEAGAFAGSWGANWAAREF